MTDLKKYRTVLLLPLLLKLVSCENFLSETVEDFGELSYLESIESWEGWTFDSHSSEADPDYEQLFDSNTTTVHRMDITINSAYYEMMEDDMTDLYGSFGSSGRMTIADDDPIYVPVTVEFNDQTWWYVAMRYKGNSSLRDSWQSGIHKLPFRLNFDYYDDVWTVIEGQRFWGFRKMTFSNGKNDDPMIRDVLASETYREAGVEAARATFCEVYIDCGDGEGPVYWGLYAMIEDPSDQMLEEQFGSSSGNLYKPDDEYNSTLSEDNFNTDYYGKSNNEDEADWSDIKDLIEAIDSSGLSDSTWQSTIESVFDVDKFLKYLAVNNTIQNWDVYGEKAHNYYLYADPNDGDRFSWFPWDLNESFTDSSLCLSIDVGSDSSRGAYNGWPLLENILDLEDYRDDYDKYIASFFVDSDSLFDETQFDSWIDCYAALIEDSVTAEIDGYTWHDSGYDSSDFYSDIDDLKNQISGRLSRAESYLSGY
ncbi:MAG: CotH kinase family protein [Spirochaetales bacterium]|nr:CotH kinase family protein [Spirochaetales bacterium]